MGSADRPFDQEELESVDPDWVEQLDAWVRAGEPVDLDTLVSQDPDRADSIRCLASVIGLLNELRDSDLLSNHHAESGSKSVHRFDPLDQLGDFRILRPIGQGGMGIVFEAYQISLNRRVALKVLPAASALDPKRFQRFQVEAQAAAALHHANIVPVFAIGNEQGVPYYAMQLIEGRSLASVIRELRQSERLDAPEPRGIASILSRSLTDAQLASKGRVAPVDLATEVSEFIDCSTVDAPPPPEVFESGLANHSETTGTSGSAVRGRDFFLNVARLGSQAAEALEHAHQHEILHRDIKPSNLLIDIQGKLWVTDFGVARIGGVSDLTLTGDVLGTLRYMSPEQASGKRTYLDARVDLYSLGATLYELLTLQPAFPGDDRPDLLRRISHEEPIAPRTINPAIPVDLETIILKAMAKIPADRYATAQDLANDLQRFLDHKPILARRPSISDRALKWSRRHLVVVASAVTVLLVLVIGVAAAGWWMTGWLAHHNAALRDALDSSEDQRRIARQQERLADERAWLAHHHLHGSRIQQAFQDWRAGHIGRAQETLRDLIPAPGQDDHRGFAWQYLWHLTRHEVELWWGHEAEVLDLAVSPDGLTLASGDERGVVILRDATTGHIRTSWQAFEKRIRNLNFSPKGDRLITFGTSKSNRNLLKVWETAPGSYVDRSHSPSFDPFSCTSAAVSSDPPRLLRTIPFLIHAATTPGGKLLATSEEDGRVRIRDVETFQVLHEFPEQVDSETALGLDPLGRLLAVNDMEGERITVWEIESWTPLISVSPGTDPVRISPGGDLIVAQNPDRDRSLWELSTGQDISHRLALAELGDLWGLAFSLDQRWIATGGTRNVVWDVETWQERARLPGHDVEAIRLAFSSDGNMVYFAGRDPVVRRWRIEPPPIATHPAGHSKEIWSLAYSPDGSIVASASDDHTIKLWQTSDSTELATLKGHAQLVTSIAISPDGRTIVSGSFDRTIRVWRLSDGRPLRTLRGHTDRIRAVAISPDGQTIASAGSDRTIHLWSLCDGSHLGTLPGHLSEVHSLAFSPDGSMLASAGNDESVRLWNLPTREEIRVFLGERPVFTVAFNPDGRSLAASSADGVVSIWSLGENSPPLSLKGPNAEARRLAYSPDGTTLAVGYQDRTIRIWDAISGQALLVLDGHEAEVFALAFDHDGRNLASGDKAGAIRIWTTEPTNPPSGASR